MEIFDVNQMKSTDIKKAAMPHYFTIMKGSAYNELSYDFVKYALNDYRAKDLLNWLTDTYSPDET
jgi:hypothetical protein